MEGCEHIQADGWRIDDSDVILGWIFPNSGAFRSAWDAIKMKLWKAYHAQFRKRGLSRVGFCRKLVVLDRTVLRILLRAIEPWPFSTSMANEIDALQRYMIGCLIRFPRQACEQPDAYCRRRAAFVKTLIDASWSQHWAMNVMRWEDHLQRDAQRQMRHYQLSEPTASIPTSWSWTPTLRNWHCMDWLERHRVVALRHGSADLTQTRTGLRSPRGGVAARWEPGLDIARQR